MPPVPSSAPPRPYRVLIRCGEVSSWVSVWAYEATEAVFAALVHAHQALGLDDAEVMEIAPDIEAYVRNLAELAQKSTPS